VEELARFATVPVINGLTDLLHPCQIMADLLTIRRTSARTSPGVKVAWVGDGNNMANSWLNAAYRFGFELRLACPEGYRPDAEILERARGAASIVLTDDPREAVEGADVVNTDVWASMGQEEEAASGSARSPATTWTSGAHGHAPPSTPSSCTACPPTAARR
jgi:ornithine carbamoyltransferase